jgi:hypothetical protein
MISIVPSHLIKPATKEKYYGFVFNFFKNTMVKKG